MAFSHRFDPTTLREYDIRGTVGRTLFEDDAFAIGRYVLLPEVIGHLARMERGAGGEVQLTDGMAKLIGKQPFHGLRYEGQRFDCGDKIGFLEAQIAYALRRPEMAEAVRSFLRNYVDPSDFVVSAVSRETV